MKDVLRRSFSYNKGTIPFNYLDVSLFVGAPKIGFFLETTLGEVGLLERSYVEHDGWDSVVNYVIVSLLSYSFQVYKLYCKTFSASGYID